MRTHGLAERLLVAAALGFVTIGACAGAAPANPSTSHEVGWGLPVGSVTPPTHPVTDDAEEAAKREPVKAADAGAPSSPDGGPRCPHGALEDPHRGFVRCLGPDERDAGWLPPPSQPPEPPPPESAPDAGAPDASAPAAAPAAPAPAGPPPVVEIGPPKFENGQVTRVEKVLSGAANDIARCIADNGGLSGAAGNLKVQFLVRVRGRAEGVEILSSKGVSAEAAACVRKLLKNKPIGAPSSDPVGVTVVITLKAPTK